MKRRGAGWQRASGFLLFAALAGCQPERLEEHPGGARPKPAPPVAAPPRPAAPPVAAVASDTLPMPADAVPVEPVWRVVNSPVPRRMLQVHRYVGIIGGQPATAKLQWYTPDSIEGSFYLHRRGPAYRLQGFRQKTGPVVLTVDAGGDAVDGQWYLQSRPGTAVLNAHWREGHRQHTVALHESYAGAVRYSIRTVFYDGGADGSIWQDFLTLPSPATVHRRLRPLLNLGPKARIRLMDEAREPLCNATNRLSVLLNDFGLFSYQLVFESRQTDGHGGRKDDQTSFLFDLVSSRPLTVASQLRPGYEMPLRRLLARQLPPDAKGDLCLAYITHDDPTLAELPDLGLQLTVTGLEATYAAAQVCGPQTLHVSYRELRPLVRPGTPLARMLAARGMW